MHKYVLNTRLCARRMSDPERYNEKQLPSCSVSDCENVAGVVIDGELLCYEHASLVLDERRRAAD